METLFNVLFSLNLFVTAISGISLMTIAKDIGTEYLKKNVLWLNTGLFLFFAVTSFVAYYLKQRNQQPIATLILGIVWLAIVLYILYAISKARWN